MSDSDTTTDTDRESPANPDPDPDVDADAAAIDDEFEYDVPQTPDERPKLTEDVATVDRDESGAILAEPTDVEYAGEMYEAAVVPMATGEWKKHQRNGADFEQMNLQAIETLFTEYVAEPAVDDIEDVRFGIAVQLIQAVVETSGLATGGDLQEKLEERIEQAQAEGN